MNSAERREARYQRRKAARMKKKAATLREYGDFETVFSFERLYESYRASVRGVGWKASTQRYKAASLANVTKDTRGIDSREIPLQGLLRVRYCGAGKAEAYSERPYLRARRTTVLVRLLPRADALPVIHLRQRSELARQRIRFRRIPGDALSRGALQKTRAGGLRPRIRFFKVFRYGTA